MACAFSLSLCSSSSSAASTCHLYRSSSSSTGTPYVALGSWPLYVLSSTRSSARPLPPVSFLVCIAISSSFISVAVWRLCLLVVSLVKFHATRGGTPCIFQVLPFPGHLIVSLRRLVVVLHLIQCHTNLPHGILHVLECAILVCLIKSFPCPRIIGWEVSVLCGGDFSPELLHLLYIFWTVPIARHMITLLSPSMAVMAYA